jgi:hypothetical protein
VQATTPLTLALDCHEGGPPRWQLGGGTPYFPTLNETINLELVETQTFGSRVVYLRYRRVSDGL